MSQSVKRRPESRKSEKCKERRRKGWEKPTRKSSQDADGAKDEFYANTGTLQQ
jgi:hypothetical protein